MVSFLVRPIELYNPKSSISINFACVVNVIFTYDLLVLISGLERSYMLRNEIYHLCDLWIEHLPEISSKIS